MRQPTCLKVSAKTDHLKETLAGLADLYEAWHAAEPGEGYDLKAAECQTRLDEAEPASQHTEGTSE